MAEQPYPLEMVEELVSIRKRLIERIVALPDPEASASEGTEEDGAPEPFECLRWGLWAAARELDHLLDDALASCVGDLSKNDPATQQQLYAFVVERCFTPHVADGQGEVSVPRFTPEECKLEVVFQYGRWMATWLKLEEDMSGPECEHRELIGFEWDERDVEI
jgi:hypothetical protein